MDKKLLKSLLHLPADIAERQRRIEKLQRTLDAMPDEVQETVQSSTDAGEASIICHTTVRGRVVNEPLRDKLKSLIAMQKEQQAQYTESLPKMIEFLEGIPDPEIRTILSVKYVERGTWADCAKAIGNGATSDSVRVKFSRYLKNLA